MQICSRYLSRIEQWTGKIILLTGVAHDEATTVDPEHHLVVKMWWNVMEYSEIWRSKMIYDEIWWVMTKHDGIRWSMTMMSSGSSAAPGGESEKMGNLYLLEALEKFLFCKYQTHWQKFLWLVLLLFILLLLRTINVDVEAILLTLKETCSHK